MNNRPLINRTLISLLTALGFLAMSFSGIVAFIVPRRVAFWTQWSFLGLSKPQWDNIHISSSLLFLIAGMLHTCYNWAPLMQYLRGIRGRASANRRDLGIALLVVLFFTVGAVIKAPPLNYFLKFYSWVQDSWVQTPVGNPSFSYAGRTGQSPAQLIATDQESSRYTGDIVVKRLRGNGLGNKTLSAICREFNLNCSAIKQKLATKKIAINDDVTIKAVAAQMGIAPIELLKAIVEGEPIGGIRGQAPN